MPKFPEPPSPRTLAALGPEIFVLPAGTALWRIYFQGGAHPTTWDQFRAWGPGNARFDHHLPPPHIQDRRILYAVDRGAACGAEVFQETRVLDRTASDPALVGFVSMRNLQLLDLTSTWPTRAGASMAINSGMRRRAQRWSQAIYEAFPALDGIRYASSMYQNVPSFALFEKAEDAIPLYPIFNRRLDDPALDTTLRNLAVEIGYLLI